MTGIYDAIGGRDAVTAAVDLFYEKVLADPTLAPYFEGIDMDHLRAHQRAFLTTALGGPEAYEGKAMADAHRGRDITDGAFDQVAAHLSSTLTELGVDDDTVSTIIGQIAGLRGDVVEVSAPAGG
ncbi:MAG TPA: group 1 truncated hemoglobin [Acidimicrobiales bacterium]|jgi:hemoglobin|nr:group 1 truncated hemoglobin [Acidimicrobiales bacterium]